MVTFNSFRQEDLRAAINRVGPSWADFHNAGIFFTGATGFLGQWVLAVLLEANRCLNLNLRVTALSRSPKQFSIRCPDLAMDPALSLVQGDVRFFEFPKGQFTHVVHAATDTSVEADDHPLALLDTIVDGTRRVLTFAQFAGIRKVLFTSSGAVYGPQPIDVRSIAEPYSGSCPTDDRRSVYGQSKRLAEQLMTIYHREFSLETKIARCFAFAGPGMAVDAHFAIGNFIRDAVDNSSVIVSGDGRPERSYLYAADAAAWLIRIMADGVPGSVYNVGSDEAFSLAEVADHVATVVGNGAEVIIRGKPDGAFRSRYIPNVDRAKALGLAVWTSLDDTISRTAEWYAYRKSGKKVDMPDDIGAQEGSQSDKRHHIYVVDIDGVLATLTPANDYRLATPIGHTIEAVNSLYDEGHRIVLFTARGSATGLDWAEVTAAQMKQWGVKYHELRFGKPAADYYVDDRMISIGEFLMHAGQRARL